MPPRTCGTSRQLPLELRRAHNNQFLFSDHYLDQLLPDDPRWQAALPEAAHLRAWLRRRYEREKGRLAGYDERQLESRWLQPILARLGQVFEARAGAQEPQPGTDRPSYLLFPDSKREPQSCTTTEPPSLAAQTADALAVSKAVRWGQPLGSKQPGGRACFEDQNPSWQIDRYLHATGLSWGILSDGRLWRLIHRDSSRRIGAVYYEVDLVDLLGRADAGALRYFTLFFGQAAFQPNPAGRVFLDDLLNASRAYALALERDLRENAYLALEQLMQGFLDLPANRLGYDGASAGPEHVLHEIYDNSLYLLYRLLFLLYGESRGLLPLGNPHYRDSYSMQRLKQQLAELKDRPVSTTEIYWGRLRELFHAIDGSDAALGCRLGVPCYSGGLFSPQAHPFLERHAVGDRALAGAIDLLCRRAGAAGPEFVDYRTLEVRQLGSIYEGLLEYQPRYAAEPMVAVREGKDERWLPAAHAPAAARVVERRDAGQVYLATDRGKRKATGAYYTPQQIVSTIVELTLGPLVRQAAEQVRLAATNDQRPTTNDQETRRQGDKGTRGQGHSKTEQSAICQSDGQRTAEDAYLSIKVLDPAMGCGHFLVEAAEFLAIGLASDQYLAPAAAGEDDLVYWKRRVAERCIYGVDKNPLAVDLARLSLWLATPASSRSNSLDQHLKHGDSLVGARVADLGAAPPVPLARQQREQQAGQNELLERQLRWRLAELVGKALEITRAETCSAEALQATQAALHGLSAPLQALANLWVSAYFGNRFSQEDYAAALDAIGAPDQLLALPAVREAQRIAAERAFFHWPLTFPQVFYDRDGRPLGEKAGFDAVVGNPPWVSFGLRAVGRLSPGEEAFYRMAYSRSAEYKLSTYALFIERAVTLLRERGYHSFIVPDSVLLGRYFSQVRKLLTTTTKVNHVVHILENVWKAANSGSSVIYSVMKEIPRDDALVLISAAPSLQMFESGRSPYDSLRQQSFARAALHRMRLITDRNVRRVLASAEVSSQALATIVKFYSGLIGKAGKSSIVIEGKPLDYRPEKYGRLIQSGGQLQRYTIRFQDHYVLLDKTLYKSGYDVEKYQNPKIFLNQTGYSLKPCLDDAGYFCLNNMHIGYPTAQEYDLKFVTSILASKLMNFYYQAISQEKGRMLAQIDIEMIDTLPIRRIGFTTPAGERAQLVAEGIGLYAAGDHDALLDFVAAQLPPDPERSDVVHDLLADLAGQMIALHRQQQRGTHAFWAELEDVAGAAFQAPRARGRQAAWLWRKAEACRPFLDPTRRATHTLDESLAWNEAAFSAFSRALGGEATTLNDLAGIYRNHSPAYRSVTARIAATDRLIDQIVYHLYGLNSQEIAVVEAA